MRKSQMTERCSWTTVASGFASGSMVVVRICGQNYALKAIGEKTKFYVQTAQEISKKLLTARTLLDSSHNTIPIQQRQDLERVVDETHEYVKAIQRFLEPAAIELDASQKLCFSMKGMWVLRDTQDTTIALNRLENAYQELNRVILVLDGCERSNAEQQHNATRKAAPQCSMMTDFLVDPKTGGNHLLHWRKRHRASRILPATTEVNLPAVSELDATNPLYEMAAPTGNSREIAINSRLSAEEISIRGGHIDQVTAEVRIYELEGSLGYLPYRKDADVSLEVPIELPTTHANLPSENMSDIPDKIDINSRMQIEHTSTNSYTQFNASSSLMFNDHFTGIRASSSQSLSSLIDTKGESNPKMNSPTKLTQRKSWLVHQVQRMQSDVQTEGPKSNLA